MSVLSLKSSFSSAHFYHQPQWSEDKNHEVFGRCFTPYGHGHNYTLEVGFIFDDQQQTLPAFVDEKKQRLQDLTSLLDHEHLNFVIPEFKNQIPTTENISLYFYKKLGGERISYVRVYEAPDLWAEYQTKDHA